MTTSVCPTCGTSYATNTTGLCTACMLRSALADGDPDMTVVTTTTSRLPRTFGPYELLEEIARGGMGVVYKARQTRLNRTVALKMLIGGAYSSESLLRRFQVEAEAAAALQHPGIVAIHEFGEHENQPYYTMDYVEGRNLAERTGGNPLPPADAARYLQAIAEAVSFAHQRGILHRDLKPSNVLIDLDDRPRVADFGLAKRLHDQPEVTLAGQTLGSPNFAPPEQATGRQSDAAVTNDVYSLGALLYNLLTGRAPFLAGTVHETLRLVVNAEPLAPRGLNPSVPRDLETICLKCLEKDPARRYSSAQALVDELQRFRNGEPILARPLSPPEQAWRWCWRHPAIASLAATVLIALTATSAIFYASAQRIERGRVKEQAARRAAEEGFYAAVMQALSRANSLVMGHFVNWPDGNLEKLRPQPGQRDLRGFEWRYYWSRAQSEALATLNTHRHVVDAAFFSRDGTRMATRSRDTTLKIWDAATKKELLSLDGVAVAGGFSTTGSHFIFSKDDRTIWRLDLASRQAALASKAGGRLISVHPDDRHAVIYGPDQRPTLHRLDDPSIPAPSRAPASTAKATVSADGRRAAVWHPGQPDIAVIDLVTGHSIARLPDSRYSVVGLALSPDGGRLVSAGMDGFFKIWNVDRGTEEHSFRAFFDPSWGLAFSPDGGSFAAGGNNILVRIWNSSTWQETERLWGHAGTVQSLAFSPDGRQLLTGGEDDRALVFSTRIQRPVTEMPKLLRGPSWGDRTAAVAFSPDSTLFAGTAADGTVKVWRAATAELITTVPVEVRNLAFSPDGRSLLTETYDGVIQRWTLGGEMLDQAARPNKLFANWQIDPLTPEERVALVADQAETRAKCGLCEIGSARDSINARVIAPTIATDGRAMIIGLPALGEVEIWDVATRKLRQPSFKAHRGKITAIAISRDGQYFATGSSDNSTRLWETATARHVATIHGHNRPVWALAFSPDGRTLAAGSCDKEIILCSIPLRRHVASFQIYNGIPQGFEQEVRLLRFSPDGNILAAGLGDGSLRFFRAAPFTETDRVND